MSFCPIQKRLHQGNSCGLFEPPKCHWVEKVPRRLQKWRDHPLKHESSRKRCRCDTVRRHQALLIPSRLYISLQWLQVQYYFPNFPRPSSKWKAIWTFIDLALENASCFTNVHIFFWSSKQLVLERQSLSTLFGSFRKWPIFATMSCVIELSEPEPFLPVFQMTCFEGMVHLYTCKWDASWFRMLELPIHCPHEAYLSSLALWWGCRTCDSGNRMLKL